MEQARLAAAHNLDHSHDRAAAVVAGGSRDRLPINTILNLLPTLPTWPEPTQPGKRTRIADADAARTILDWLCTHPGEGWQDRWVVSGADDNTDWLDRLIVTDGKRSPGTQHDSLTKALTALLLCRIVRPSYQFLDSYRPIALYSYTRRVFRPDLFAVIEEHAHRSHVRDTHLKVALVPISKMVLHTGRDIDQLTAEDLLTYRTWCQGHRDRVDPGLALAWSLLREVTDLGEHLRLVDALRSGQLSTAELVDAHHIGCQPVRDVLVRYLDERRPALDYSSLTSLAGRLVGAFWADIERHHPDIDTLRLPKHVAEDWKRRLKMTSRGGRTRPRKDYLQILICIRSFYRDIQEWAVGDPSWAEWSFPSPVSKADTAGHRKARRQVTAEMHQRVRERLPHLPTLVDSAERYKADQATFLGMVQQTPIGATLTYAGRQYRRVQPQAYQTRYYRDSAPPDHARDLVNGELIDVGHREHEAFWAWAVIEVLRHTGCRIEELLETTHLGLVSYKLPDTGEVVPMLQIVPSKANEERLLLVGPELASVLATIITRLRAQNGGAIALTTRYDPYERVLGPPLPHLIQHRNGWKWNVPSNTTVQKWISQAVARTGLTDTIGQPLRYTAHDFRRLFATDAVSSGLPIHIVARLLGHKNLDTTQAYTAVFDEELVRSYRAFLDKRRALRPEAEYREPTDAEWRDFQAHFHARKLELGECGRPYGSPCKHEHSCIRCSSLRLDLRARPRLVEIIGNLNERIQEAKLNGWQGEVAGLEISLREAAQKLVRLDRMLDRQPTGPTNLGMPIIGGSTR
jgi:integrase